MDFGGFGSFGQLFVCSLITNLSDFFSFMVTLLVNLNRFGFGKKTCKTTRKEKAKTLVAVTKSGNHAPN